MEKAINKKKNIAVALIVIVAISLWMAKNMSTKSTDSEIPLFTVEKGLLTISVLEAGTITAREVEIIKCEVESRPTILWLIDEATRVKKGDKLMELDSSELVEYKMNKEIEVKNTKTDVIIASETFEVIKNKAESDVEQAELNLKFAEMDLEKYVEGEYPNELKVNQTNIVLAKEELERAKEKLSYSEQLAKEKYISSTELKTDQLAYQKAELELNLAENRLDLLKSYTHKRMLEELESDVKQAGMALERTRRSASASVVQGDVALLAKQAKADQVQSLFDKIEDQISKTVIRAPMDGMVIYATSAKRISRYSSVEPLDEGQVVRERQELFYLPTADLVKVEAKIHEANLDKVKVGFPVTIKVDAIPGESFVGNVNKIAILPDQQSMHMNPDLKVYDIEIFVDDKGPDSASRKLRTGMGCRVEILAAEFEDALYVPIQSVITVADQPTVYVYEKGKSKPRSVEIGMDNNRMIRIINGLEEGEQVLLAPPLAEAEVKHSKNSKKREASSSQPNKMGPGDRKGNKKRAPGKTGGPGAENR